MTTVNVCPAVHQEEFQPSEKCTIKVRTLYSEMQENRFAKFAALFFSAVLFYSMLIIEGSLYNTMCIADYYINFQKVLAVGTMAYLANTMRYVNYDS